MKSRFPACNICFGLLLAFFLTGCGSAGKNEEDEKISTIRLHLEEPAAVEGRTMTARVLRSAPIELTVGSQPFLHEGYVDGARLITSDSGPTIVIQFNSSGALYLENLTAVSIGKRIVIGAQFPEPRWIAAPMITRRIGDGRLTFTPDANEDEARRLVDGLNELVQRRNSLFR